MLTDIRRSLLTRAFDLLYGPLVLLHEPLGVLFHGPAWQGRRLALLTELPAAAVVIEVGAGEGRLLRELGFRAIHSTGYEPSPAMRRRAWIRSIGLIAGRAENLPLPDAAVDLILITYPGPWIFEPETWSEFARVLRDGGQVRILAGGRLGVGGDAGLRGGLLGLIYGRPSEAVPALNVAISSGIDGEWSWRPDRWGAALIWLGERRRRSVVD